MNPAGFAAALEHVRLVPRRMKLSVAEVIKPRWIASSRGWTATLEGKKLRLIEPETEH